MSTLVSSKLKKILADPKSRNDLFQFLSNKNKSEDEIDISKEKNIEKFKVKKTGNE